MPRRRLPPPPPDRLAAILGLPSPAEVFDEQTEPAWVPEADLPATGGGGLRDPRSGWTPRRPEAGSGAGLRGRAPQVADDRDAAVGAADGWSAAEPDVAEPEVAEAPGSRSGRHRRTAPPGPALVTVPAALRDLIARPSRLSVLGLLVVVVLAGLVLGLRVAWARASAQPQPVTAVAGDPLVTRSVPAAFATAGERSAARPGSTGQPAVGAATTPSPLPSAATVLLVHVVGQIRHPGVVRLDPGARVKDAVHAAGGATRGADLSGLNLARPVADGEQIVVPRPGERPTPLPGAPPAAGAAPGGAGEPGAPSTPLDLNTATAGELEALPGIGPVLSQRIVDWRTEHGRFTNVDELLEVSGIGDKMLQQIRPEVRI